MNKRMNRAVFIAAIICVMLITTVMTFVDLGRIGQSLSVLGLVYCIGKIQNTEI